MKGSIEMGDEFMARKNKNSKGLEIAKMIIDEYEPKTAKDMEDALKEIFGPMFQSMLQGELDSHLGYESSSHEFKDSDNRRNGYGSKKLKSSLGELEINVPRDRDASFDPKIIPKRSNDISGIEEKVLAMYARGMSQRDIAETIKDIYNFDISHDMVSNITDHVLEELEEWQSRPLKPFYPFIFVDCMSVVVRRDYETKSCALYTILGYDIDGKKDILGLWLSENESKNYWMQVFDEIKQRGVEDILFISMDGLTGLEEGAKAIFKKAIIQRCIVHLLRNSLKYIPSKDYKQYCSMIKKVYGAANLKIAEVEFKKIEEKFVNYPGALKIWKNNWEHVAQLFDYGSAIRKVMYTTNAIESINSSFRKVTKKGAFPSEEAVYKALYLRVKELYRKWSNARVNNWANVRNQLIINDNFSERISKYDNN